MPCPANELGEIARFVAIQKFKGEAFVARALLDGGVQWDRPAYSRQACPLAIIDCDFVRKPRSEGLGVAKGAQARVPVPLKVAFAVRRKLGPGLEVQVVFQGRTCTFVLAVENSGRSARQMRHLPSTVETGTGGFQFETNVLFRWPSLACTSISTGSTARS